MAEGGGYDDLGELFVSESFDDFAEVVVGECGGGGGDGGGGGGGGVGGEYDAVFFELSFLHGVH